MHRIRQNRYSVALMLLLAMVFTIGGMPAQAAACAEMGMQSPALPAAPALAVAPAATETCPATGIPGCGCCETAAPVAPSDAPAATLGSPQCDCSVEAPSVPLAAVAKPVLFTISYALLPAVAGSMTLQFPSATAASVPSPADSPPQIPVAFSFPGRAPPTS